MNTGKTDRPKRLDKAAWLAWPATRAVFAALGADGHTARAVGGAVRDSLLGRRVSDVDMATDADPQTAMRLAKDAGLKVIPTGIDHGTVTVVAKGRPFEVTTLRADVETYGRRAKVAYTQDWEADASRRDFTINALYADADGTLFDPLGGLADIEARRVRFIGDSRERIREDFLRILRFFRFIAELEAPDIDPDGLAACVRERAGLKHLASERVHGELRRLLTAAGVIPALSAMFDHGLLVDALAGVPYLPRLERLVALERELGHEPGATLRLAALAVAVREDAERLAVKLRLSNDEAARLAGASGYRAITAGMGDNAAKALLYRVGADPWPDLAMMAWAADGAGPDVKAWRTLLDLPERWPVPEFPVTGGDITGLGVPAGPDVGAILRKLESAWIESGFSGHRDDLLEQAKRIAGMHRREQRSSE